MKNRNSKKTVVLGASPNKNRYSYAAVERLMAKGHEVIPIGLRKGLINGIEIKNDLKPEKEIDTISMYVGPRNQEYYWDFIESTMPKRIIFNPGAENPELAERAKNMGIETENACTLVLLGLNSY